ncbi:MULTISPECIES: TlpA disulfide reductase family protein [Pseudoalteromonas]|uniref:Thioredoxin domain-containing protein n=1 Tax=Pseudoalteromonas aurantia 208 TaxID=1314867 RepID=A0ABR9EG97_9GAMM|nr:MULTISPECIES: TlpA disulfide reductase family protein [Pseudoalteromonas]MBE0370017.1 hypothetical protein [Pseudoalteromonas aurantia 208]MBQ4847176.1 TlpA family protein disulfide reductase [Pseudoalteromonas sp. MMG005]
MKRYYAVIYSLLLIGLTHNACYASQLIKPLVLNTIQGKTIHTQNKITYLKFWATWCRYCIEEMPHLQKTANTKREQTHVVSINVGLNQSPQLVSRFLSQYNYTFPTVFDDGSLVERFKITGTPTHIIIDKQGNIIHRSALLTDELKAKLLDLTTQGQHHE